MPRPRPKTLSPTLMQTLLTQVSPLRQTVNETARTLRTGTAQYRALSKLLEALDKVSEAVLEIEPPHMSAPGFAANLVTQSGPITNASTMMPL